MWLKYKLRAKFHMVSGQFVHILVPFMRYKFIETSEVYLIFYHRKTLKMIQQEQEKMFLIYLLICIGLTCKGYVRLYLITGNSY